MKSFTIAAFTVLAGLANAVKFTNNAYVVTAGQPFTLTWVEAVGSVTIKLKNGPATNLEDVETLTTGATTPSGSFTWTPDASLPSDTYAFEIDDDTNVPNYSAQFQYFGSASATSSSVSITSSASASASNSASSTSETSSASTSESSTSSATTSGSSSSSASKTSSANSTRTSSASTSTTSTPNTNDARGLAAPFIAPLLLIAGIAAL